MRNRFLYIFILLFHFELEYDQRADQSIPSYSLRCSDAKQWSCTDFLTRLIYSHTFYFSLFCVFIFSSVLSLLFEINTTATATRNCKRNKCVCLMHLLYALFSLILNVCACLHWLPACQSDRPPACLPARPTASTDNFHINLTNIWTEKRSRPIANFTLARVILDCVGVSSLSAIFGTITRGKSKLMRHINWFHRVSLSVSITNNWSKSLSR